MLSASGVPSAARNAGGTRGRKRPGTPNMVAAVALTRLKARRTGSRNAGSSTGICYDTSSQYRRRIVARQRGDSSFDQFRDCATLPAGAPMNENTIAQVRKEAEAIYRAESRRVFATLIRLLGDFDLAEEALHDPFRAALEQWP